ncbi:MAG: ABC transporter ATP-binding protein [Acidobacteria bacterium]|nr:MAG: ABC transporter ATP-binding protein [Acidobacteriota bacterium]
MTDSHPDFLQFCNVSKSFGATKAVDCVSLGVKRGEFFSLLGPSGCGKTTLLRLVAGFERPDLGTIVLDGRDLTDLPPHRRKVNTIFQSYALFPHLTVRENIAFGPRTAGWAKAEIARELDKMLHLIQMEAYAGQKPDQLSGGQKQRVAIARALINEPEVLLLDEPLAALDLKLRQRMLVELDQIHDEVGITFLYVTHDQAEAMSLSDRIAVMNAGRIEQVGSPFEIYESPRSSFVAAFIGDTNFLRGRVLECGDSGYACLEVGSFGPVRCRNGKQTRAGEHVYLSVRPEKFQITRDRPDPDGVHNVINGTVEDVIYLGTHTRYRVGVQESIISVFVQHSRLLHQEKIVNRNDEVWLRWHADDGFVVEKDLKDPKDPRDGR